MKKALILSGGGARGAFQIGVWKYLAEKNWKPDIICGSSVGAINAAGIGSGLDIKKLVRIWTTYNRRRMYKLNLLQFLAYALFGRELKPLLDAGGVESMLKEYIDFQHLRNNRMKIVVSTVNVHTARPCFFDNSEIQMEHILASGAMPVLFSCQNIKGVPHWDGGIMSNIPLLPALEFGAEQIIIVMLSPVGHSPHPFPGDVRTALEHVFEQFLSASYQTALLSRAYEDRCLPTSLPEYRKNGYTAKQPEIICLAPAKMLGFSSLLNFSLRQAESLIDEGYKTACSRLKPFI